MTCHRFALPGGGFGYVCTRGDDRRRAPRCSVINCGRPAEVLCDYPLGGKLAGQTCDQPLCAAHAKHVGEDRDLCPAHARMEER